MEKIIQGNWDGEQIYRDKTIGDILVEELNKNMEKRKLDGSRFSDKLNLGLNAVEEAQAINTINRNYTNSELPLENLGNEYQENVVEDYQREEQLSQWESYQAKSE